MLYLLEGREEDVFWRMRGDSHSPFVQEDVQAWKGIGREWRHFSWGLGRGLGRQTAGRSRKNFLTSGWTQQLGSMVESDQIVSCTAV